MAPIDITIFVIFFAQHIHDQESGEHEENINAHVSVAAESPQPEPVIFEIFQHISALVKFESRGW